MKVGVLALQGDVGEHISATKNAADALNLDCEIIEVRTKADLKGISALIIPGGESTVLQKLCEREEIFEEIKQIKHIFGTCAGAIMLAKKAGNTGEEQKTFEVMDIEICRNAYGRQLDSFEETLNTELGTLNAVFIRAPGIKKIGKGVMALAKRGTEIVACEQKTGQGHYIAACFHPELSTTKFHEHFLRWLL